MSFDPYGSPFQFGKPFDGDEHAKQKFDREAEKAIEAEKAMAEVFVRIDERMGRLEVELAKRREALRDVVGLDERLAEQTIAGVYARILTAVFTGDN